MDVKTTSSELKLIAKGISEGNVLDNKIVSVVKKFFSVELPKFIETVKRQIIRSIHFFALKTFENKQMLLL